MQKKTVKSSLKQINDILTIDKTIGLESLPDDLKQVAFYRLNNREASLSTIAEALGIKNPHYIISSIKFLRLLIL